MVYFGSWYNEVLKAPPPLKKYAYDIMCIPGSSHNDPGSKILDPPLSSCQKLFSFFTRVLTDAGDALSANRIMENCNNQSLPPSWPELNVKKQEILAFNFKARGPGTRDTRHSFDKT